MSQLPEQNSQDRLRGARQEELADILAGEEDAHPDEGLQADELPGGQGVRFGRHQILSPFRSLMDRARQAASPVSNPDPEDTSQQEPGLLDPVALALLSRRSTLKKAGATTAIVAAFVAGIAVDRAATQGDKDPTERIRRALEERFHVRLTTEYGATWSLENLTVIAQILDVLPAHWFRPPSGEVMELVEIAFDKAPAPVQEKTPLSDTALPDYRITLSNFSTHAGESYAFDELYYTEEMIRYIATVAIPRTPIEGHTGMTPWFEAVDRVLGMPLKQFTVQQFIPSIKAKYLQVLRKVEGGIPRDREEEYRATFAIELLSALITPGWQDSTMRVYPNDLLPILAIHFMRGKNYFFDMYTEMFGDKMANKLYSFARNAIFGGRTYGGYPLPSSDGPYYSGPTILMPSFNLSMYGIK